MGRVERFNEAYNYIRYARIVKNQAELAKLSKNSRSNISSALNGKESILSDPFLIKFNESVGKIFSLEWLLYGTGDMLSAPSSTISNTGVINVRGDVNANCNTVNNINSNEKLDEMEDSEVYAETYEPAPIIPSVWVKRRDFDIVEAIEEQRDALERSKVVVAGTPVDAWHLMPDNSMAPYYLKGDKIALAIASTKKIFPGRVYGIDTIPHGLIVCALYNPPNGYIAHCYNNKEHPDFEIEDNDVLSIFNVACLVRI